MNTIQTKNVRAHERPHRASDLPDLLGVGRSTAYNLLKSGAIRSVRAGKRYLIPADALAEFLAGGN